MKPEVAAAIEELKRQFPDAVLTISGDDAGGAKVILEQVAIGGKYSPPSTWVGFHITPQYPYADIYPVFIGGDVRLADGRSFEAPVTNGHMFEGRNAIQVSRRSALAESGTQKAVAKIMKVLYYLENYQ